MNKKGKTTIVLSVILTLVILVSSIYIFMPEKVKLVVGDTNSKMYVWEDEKWVLGATEYVNIYDGTTKMRASSRDVLTETIDNITTITRISKWKDDISTIDTYTFDSTVDNVELFPISHDINIINAENKIIHFEYRDLEYNGITRDAISPESFGHKMFIEWDETDNFMWAKVYQQSVASDKLIVRYRVTSNDETYTVRLFDPPVTRDFLCYQETATTATDCGGLSTGNYNNASAVNIENIYDGNWATYGLAVTDSAISDILWINYTKPNGATNTSVWVIKNYNEGELDLPIPEACFNQEQLQFKISSKKNDTDDWNRWYCYNSTDWELVHNKEGQKKDAQIFEEAMRWNISHTIETISSVIKTDDDNLCYSDVVSNGGLEGWCNATDDVYETLRYGYIWYKNGTSFSEHIVPSIGWCYQETANVSTACGGLDGGTYLVVNESLWDYPGSYLYDGNWVSYNINTWEEPEGVFYINYSKPLSVDNNSLWQVKYRNVSEDTPTENITIPTECFEQSTLQLAIISNNSCTDCEHIRFECYNGTNWDVIKLVDFTGGVNKYPRVYEEAMWWHIGDNEIYYPEGVEANLANISLSNISLGDNWTFSCIAYSEINDSEWLNSTEVTIYNLSFLIDDVDVSTLSSPIQKELGSVILNATINDGTVYIDHSYTDFGTNYSSGSPSTQFDAEITKFHKRTTADGDSNTTLYYNGPENQSFNVLGHEYDEFNNLSFNITGGLYNGTFPSGVSIYVNGELSNSIGMLSNTTSFTETEFNDSTTSKNITFLEEQLYNAGYVRIPKTANVTNAQLNVSGIDSEGLYTGENWDTSQYGIENYSKGCYPRGLSNNGTHLFVLCGETLDGEHYLVSTSLNGTFEKIISNLSNEVEYNPTYSGLTQDSDYFYLEDTGYDVYKINVTSGEYVTKWEPNYAAQNNIYGLEVVGSYIYIGGPDSGTSKICKYTTSGSYQTCYDVSSSMSESIVKITSDGSYIWANNRDNNLIYKFDMTGNYISTWTDALGSSYGGMTQDGTYFYTSGSIQKQVYKYLKQGYPTNLYLEVGNIDGDVEWNYTNELNTTVRTDDFSTKLNLYLDSCTADSNGFCTVPLYMYSSPGTVQISDIEIDYTYQPNPIYLDNDLVQDVLDAGNGYTNITVTIYNEDNGSVFVNAIDYDYLGGGSPTYTIKAHGVGDYCYIENTLTYSYSGWDYSLPDNIDYVDWYPPSPTAQNVQPFGQTDTIPIFNVTTENYDANMDFYIKQYDDETSCVTIKVSDTGEDVDYCYQEFTNVSTACGGVNTGYYTFSGTSWNDQENTADGDWDTYSWPDGQTSAKLYSYYYKPVGVTTNNAIWQVKSGLDEIRNLNYTVTDDCMSAFDDYILLRFYSYSKGAGGLSSRIKAECWDGTSYDELVDYSDSAGSVPQMYEEAIWWDVSATPMVNDTYIKLESNLSSGTNFGIWLYANLDCSYTDWQVWQPTIQMKGETTT